ncbi:hypothetical protein ACKWTF_016739 [Chironomus riparius]
MKIFKIAFLIIFIFKMSTTKKESYDFGTRYTDLSCSADNVTVVLRYCYLKAYTRRLVTANIGASLPSPLTKPIFIQIIYSYRYGNVYREAMKSPKVDWCDFMDGASKNVFMTSLFNELKNSVGDFFHKCPYSGIVDIKNISSEHEKAAGILWEDQF